MRRRRRSLAGVLALLALSPRVHASEPAKTPIQIDARAAGALGDGVHDDRPALQGALDRLAVAGGVLELPAGTYLLGAPLLVRGDGLTVRGEGAILRAGAGFPAGPEPRALLATPAAGDGPAVRRIAVLGVALDGAGIASRALALERAHDVTLRALHVRGVRPGGGGAIVVRSTADRETDTGEVTVSENVVELDEATSGIVLRNVVNCLVSGNRVQGTGREGGHGIDLTLSRGCTVSDNVILGADVGVLADETNHIQLIGNYVYDARTGFRAGVRPDGRRPAANNVYVNNRVLTGGSGFVVGGSGMLLIGNYAAFLKPGPAIWVQGAGTHDALVGNNPSVAGDAGIRFDASDGVVVANVPISNDGPGIEVNGARVAVSANAAVSNRIGIRLGERARACTVVGNTVEKAAEAPLVLGGGEHTVRDNTGTGGVLPERGRGATYGSGEVDVRAARTAIAADFPDDRYLVTVEWAADPGGREWIAEKTRTGFVITLPASPPAPVRVRWLARGL